MKFFGQLARMPQTLFCLLIIFLVNCSAVAAERAWAKKDGTSFKAEFVKEIFGSAMFKTSDGGKLFVDISDLSQTDVTFIHTMVPPKVEISFSKRSGLKERSIFARDEDEIEIVTGAVSVRKVSKAPYEGKVTVEVFMIGREIATPEVYYLLDRKRETFIFDEEKKNIHVFEVPVEVRWYREYNNQSRGRKFAGYVAIVTDSNGVDFGFSSDLDWITEDKVESLRKLRAHNFLSKRCRKTSVPRPDYYTERAVWSRH
ncbi:MAG: hypothetical protein AB7E95_09300 [Kiritimatiellales bacterium]